MLLISNNRAQGKTMSAIMSWTQAHSIVVKRPIYVENDGSLYGPRLSNRPARNLRSHNQLLIQLSVALLSNIVQTHYASMQKLAYKARVYISCIMTKPAFAYAKRKMQISWAVTAPRGAEDKGTVFTVCYSTSISFMKYPKL